MAKLRVSPFKANIIESDPDAFGLRRKEIIACSESLYNNRSILISGPKGIGKSSLGNQMQSVLEGEKILLERCGITNTFPKTLCLFYACDKNNSLQQLVQDILYNLEQKCLLISKSKISFELNLGVFKAGLESEIQRNTPASLATQLVAGLTAMVSGVNKILQYHSINIMLDEVDEIAEDINFGHFLKIVHEALQSNRIPVTFILAGQQGVYSRFMREDAAFERIIRHIPLSILEPESANYVLDFAAHKANPMYKYDADAKNLILGLASGYPYVLHLVGDASYMEMENDTRMKQSDVLLGVENILKTDKREKYVNYLRKLKEKEKRILMSLGSFETNSIPAEIPLTWFQSYLQDYESNKLGYDNAYSSLVEQGILLPIKQGLACRFSEELFRVFISLTHLEQQELIKLKADAKAVLELKNLSEAEIEDRILRGEIRIAQLDQDARKHIFKRLRESVKNMKYDLDWDADDLLELSYDDNLGAVVDSQIFNYDDLYDEHQELPTDNDIEGTILNVFSLDEIENMSYELGITYEELPKENKEHVVEYIVKFANKNELTRELIRLCQEMNPDLTWDSDFSE